MDGRLRGAYDDEGGDGLVEPAVLLEEVAEDDAGAEERDEEVDGDHRRVVRGRQRAAEPRQLRRHHAKPHHEFDEIASSGEREGGQVSPEGPS